jgi:hypothetical protein
MAGLPLAKPQKRPIVSTPFSLSSLGGISTPERRSDRRRIRRRREWGGKPPQRARARHQRPSPQGFGTTYAKPAGHTPEDAPTAAHKRSSQKRGLGTRPARAQPAAAPRSGQKTGPAPLHPEPPGRPDERPRQGPGRPGRGGPHQGLPQGNHSPGALAVARSRSESHRSSPRTQGGPQAARGDPRTVPIPRTLPRTQDGTMRAENELRFGGHLLIKANTDHGDFAPMSKDVIPARTPARTLAGCPNAHRATALQCVGLRAEQRGDHAPRHGAKAPPTTHTERKHPTQPPSAQSGPSRMPGGPRRASSTQPPHAQGRTTLRRTRQGSLGPSAMPHATADAEPASTASETRLERIRVTPRPRDRGPPARGKSRNAGPPGAERAAPWLRPAGWGGEPAKAGTFRNGVTCA